MRQVPEKPFLEYTLIGSGRVALHIKNYLEKLEIPYKCWSRNNDPDFNSLDRRNAQDRLFETLETSHHVLLLISDSEIEGFIEEHQVLLNDKILVHFSGSLISEFAYSAHPLMTFSKNLYELEDYEKIPFVIEDCGPDLEVLFPYLNNPSFKIQKKLKPLYHALCVASGNFTTLLWNSVLTQFEEKLQLPEFLLYPYLERIFINILQDSKSALTGPLQRKDKNTIDSNIKALEGNELQAIYQSFVSLCEQRPTQETHRKEKREQ
jgi:predicted short-subunit dehydrogenase-like oxidoreductase (DUF2520 family)